MSILTETSVPLSNFEYSEFIMKVISDSWLTDRAFRPYKGYKIPKYFENWLIDNRKDHPGFKNFVFYSREIFSPEALIIIDLFLK